MNGTELVFNKSQHSYMPFSSLELSFYRHPEKSYWSMCLNSSFFCMNTPRSQYKLVFLFWGFFLIFDTSLFFFFYCRLSTIVSIFTPPYLSLPPTLTPTPFGFVHVSFIHVQKYHFYCIFSIMIQLLYIPPPPQLPPCYSCA